MKKQIAIYSQQKNGRYKVTGWRDMEAEDVKRYFSQSLIPKDQSKKTIGNYCERCGILIGKEYLNKKPKWWQKWCVCEECYEHKNGGKPENTPDLEDIKRFKIYN